MRADKVLLLFFWVGGIGLWSMSVWGGWAEKTYRMIKDSDTAWYWLCVMRIPRNQENCIRFLKGTSILGMIILTLITGAVLLWGK
jgi:hypothetical protein